MAHVCGSRCLSSVVGYVVQMLGNDYKNNLVYNKNWQSFLWSIKEGSIIIGTDLNPKEWSGAWSWKEVVTPVVLSDLVYPSIMWQVKPSLIFRYRSEKSSCVTSWRWSSGRAVRAPCAFGAVGSGPVSQSQLGFWASFPRRGTKTKYCHQEACQKGQSVCTNLSAFLTLRALLTVSKSVLSPKIQPMFLPLGRWFRN